MLHNEEMIGEIIDILRKADEREVEISLEFIRSLTRK